MRKDGEYYKEIGALLSSYCTSTQKTLLQKDEAEVGAENMSELTMNSGVFVAFFCGRVQFPICTLVHPQLLFTKPDVLLGHVERTSSCLKEFLCFECLKLYIVSVEQFIKWLLIVHSSFSHMHILIYVRRMQFWFCCISTTTAVVKHSHVGLWVLASHFLCSLAPKCVPSPCDCRFLGQ